MLQGQPSAVASATSALDLARRYTARGWRPFPIPRGSKKPTVPWGVKVASHPTDQMLQLWFPAGAEWNIGIGTKFSRLLVLDEDTPGELDKLCATEGRSLPPTYTVHTSKGRQLYFRDDEGILGNRTDVQGYDIDVRGAGDSTGGFVVAAGSLHPDGVEYLAEDDAADAEPLPDWVREWLTRPEPGKAPELPPRSTVINAADRFFTSADPRGTRRFTMAQAQAYVREQAEARVRGAQNGTRNDALNAAAVVVGHFVPQFWPYDVAARSLVELGLSVGLAAEEVPATVNSGLSAGLKEPYERFEPPTEPAPAELEEADSWRPADLASILDGTRERPTPSVGVVREDGARFLYPGKEHAVIGEMEAGKSWFALACVAAELRADHRVVYIHFEESDPTDTVLRLSQQFGVAREQLLSGFVFIGPERPVRPGELDELCAQRAPSLVVLDGQNEAMALHGQAIYDADGAAAYRRLVVRPFTRAGAAVISLDHVVKDPEKNRGGYAFGSVHKGNGLNGALLLLENDEPFGDGRKGVTNVYVTKDRPGQLRALGRPTKVARKTFVGQMRIDAELAGMWTFRFTKPAAELDGLDPEFEQAREVRAVRELDAEVLGVVTRWEDLGTPADTEDVKGVVKRRRADVVEALSRLVDSGQITMYLGARGKKTYSTRTRSQDQESQPF